MENIYNTYRYIDILIYLYIYRGYMNFFSYIYVCIRMYTYITMYIHIYTCIYVCICIRTHKKDLK